MVVGNRTFNKSFYSKLSKRIEQKPTSFFKFGLREQERLSCKTAFAELFKVFHVLFRSKVANLTALSVLMISGTIRPSSNTSSKMRCSSIKRFLLISSAPWISRGNSRNGRTRRGNRRSLLPVISNGKNKLRSSTLRTWKKEE